MPNNYISVDITKTRGAAVMNSSTIMLGVLDALTSIKNAMDNMIATTDYSVVESNFGVPVGKGQTLYNIVAGCVTDLNASVNVSELITWLGAIRTP